MRPRPRSSSKKRPKTTAAQFHKMLEPLGSFMPGVPVRCKVAEACIPNDTRPAPVNVCQRCPLHTLCVHEQIDMLLLSHAAAAAAPFANEIDGVFTVTVGWLQQ
jgi:hypothetical protein